MEHGAACWLCRGSLAAQGGVTREVGVDSSSHLIQASRQEVLQKLVAGLTQI